VTIESFKLGEKLRVRKITVNDSNTIVGIKGCNEDVFCVLDCLHVARGNETCRADEGESSGLAI
jgi:hypothetical protein